MTKRIKNPRDLILGIVMTAISLYLLFSSKVVKGMTLLYTDITIAKAGTYIRILGGLLLILSVSLILRAIGVFGGKQEEPSGKKIADSFVIVGFVALILYIPLMKLIGFTVSSMLLMVCFTFMIRLREKKVDLHDKQALLKNLGVAVLYAVVLVLILEALFTRVLHVRLP